MAARDCHLSYTECLRMSRIPVSVQLSVGCGWRGVLSGGGGTRFASHLYGRLVQTGDRMSRRSDHLFATSLSMRSLFPHVFTPRSDVFFRPKCVHSCLECVQFAFACVHFARGPPHPQQGQRPRRARRGLALVQALKSGGAAGVTGRRAGFRPRRVWDGFEDRTQALSWGMCAKNEERRWT